MSDPRHQVVVITLDATGEQIRVEGTRSRFSVREGCMFIAMPDDGHELVIPVCRVRGVDIRRIRRKGDPRGPTPAPAAPDAP